MPTAASTEHPDPELKRLILLSLCARYYAQQMEQDFVANVFAAAQSLNGAFQQGQLSSIAHLDTNQNGIIVDLPGWPDEIPTWQQHLKSEKSLIEKVVRKREIPTDILRVALRVDAQGPQDFQKATAEYLEQLCKQGYRVWRPTQYPDEDPAVDNRVVDPLSSGYSNISILLVDYSKTDLSPVVVEVQFLQPHMFPLAGIHIAYDLSKDLKRVLTSNQKKLERFFLDHPDLTEDDQTALEQISADIEGIRDERQRTDFFRWLVHARAFRRDNPEANLEDYINGFEEAPRLREVLEERRADPQFAVARTTRAEFAMNELRKRHPNVLAMLEEAADEYSRNPPVTTTIIAEEKHHCLGTIQRVRDHLWKKSTKLREVWKDNVK